MAVQTTRKPVGPQVELATAQLVMDECNRLMRVAESIGDARLRFHLHSVPRHVYDQLVGTNEYQGFVDKDSPAPRPYWSKTVGKIPIDTDEPPTSSTPQPVEPVRVIA